MAVKIERATYKTKHYAALAAAMRDDDRREALAMLGMGGAPALFLSMYCSREMYTAETDEGTPLCAWGATCVRWVPWDDLAAALQAASSEESTAP